MKKIKTFLLSLVVILSGALVFTTLTSVIYSLDTPTYQDKKYITNIEKTTVDGVEYFSLFYSDNTSSVISTNGNKNYVISIEPTNTNDIYVLRYSDGSTSTLDLTEDNSKGGITSIEKNSTDSIDTYTFHYGNNSSVSIPVINNVDSMTGNSINMLTLVREYCNENDIDLEEYINGKLTTDYIKTASNKALRSAVSVWCVTKYLDNSRLVYNSSTHSREATKSVSSSAGAGTIYKVDALSNGEIDLDGYSYIITNYHVIYSDDSTDENHLPSVVKVFQYGTNEAIGKTGNTDEDGYPEVQYGAGAIDATVIGGTAQYDLAVLKVKNSDLLKYNSSFRAANIAKGYEVAEQCIAIGNPDAMGISVTQGIISKYSEDITITSVVDNSSTKIRVLRMDAPVNSGNSGGGLFNTKGELIGVVNAKSTQYDEMNYALPIDNVTKVVDNIIDGYLSTGEFYYPQKLIWGVTVYQELVSNSYDEQEDKHIQLNDVVVSTINDNAYAKGSLQVGDIIHSITISHKNGTIDTYNINKSYELADILFTIRAGDSFVVFGDRDEEKGIILFAKTVQSADLATIK